MLPYTKIMSGIAIIGLVHVSHAQETPLYIGSRLELFVDRYLIDTMDHVIHTLSTPIQRETALYFDQPWEGRYCGYVTVFKDNDVYRMYYRGLPESGKDGSNKECTCYAESMDGIKWIKPTLGLFEFDGNRENNIVLANHAPYSHNFAPFLNVRPGTPPEQRYLAFAGTVDTGLSIFASPDGIHWQMLHESVLRDGAFDSQNVAFWSEIEQCYVCYFRIWTKRNFRGYRWVSRSTSPDLIHWTKPEPMRTCNTPLEHIYTNQTTPYFRAPHIYIALAARFMSGRRVVSEDIARRLGIEGDYFNDCSDSVLMTSRGGTLYDRTFMEGFIRPGIGPENWTSRTNSPAWGIVPTSDSEISLYVLHNYAQPKARIDRYSLRTDGFASIKANYEGGYVVTKPLTFSGSRLFINFSTSAAGYIKVGLLNKDKSPIEGYAFDDCVEIVGNALEQEVTWGSKSSLNDLSEKIIRLQFFLKDADLYAFQFK